MHGDKNTSARLCAKNSGVSLYTRGEGRICGTLLYIGCIHVDLRIPRLIWECLHMHKLYLGKSIANRQIYAMVWLLLK